MSINSLEITRKIIQIATIVACVGFVPLAIFTPWSSERVFEELGGFSTIYTFYHYNIYLGLAYILPTAFFFATNSSMKRYFRRLKAEATQTSQFCVICGKTNVGEYCTYCGNQI